jgi:hypothetical protein
MDGSAQAERPASPRPGELYRHYRGRPCRVVGVARLARKGEWLVIYHLESQPEFLLAMPLKEFLGAVAGPDGSDRPRFVRVPLGQSQPEAG